MTNYSGKDAQMRKVSLVKKKIGESISDAGSENRQLTVFMCEADWEAICGNDNPFKVSPHPLGVTSGSLDDLQASIPALSKLSTVSTTIPPPSPLPYHSPKHVSQNFKPSNQQQLATKETTLPTPNH